MEIQNEIKKLINDGTVSINGDSEIDEIKKALMYSIMGDMFFIYLSFISYLYLDKKFEELFDVLGGYDGKCDIVIFGSDHIRYGSCKHQRKYQHNSRL